jgi:hypothetical protein
MTTHDNSICCSHPAGEVACTVKRAGGVTRGQLSAMYVDTYRRIICYQKTKPSPLRHPAGSSRYFLGDSTVSLVQYTYTDNLCRPEV